MHNAIVSVARTLGVLAAGLSGVAALAQAPLPVPNLPPNPVKSEVTLPPEAARPPAGVGLIEIYDGPRRTVHYVAPNLSPGERSSLNDLARVENEAAYAEDVLALKRRYIDSELTLEPYRRSVQQQ